MGNQLLLKTIDKLLFLNKTVGLSDVQILVLESTLAGASYSQIAGKSTYTIEYLREIGSKLWQTLAELLGEPVNKRNLRSVLERYQQSAVLAELDRKYFWGEAIDVSIFYGRVQELKTLEKWIVKDRCRLIEILAIGGMGKTALAVKLAQQMPTEFDFVVWRSLRNAPPLADFLAEVIALISHQQEIELVVEPTVHISRLLHYLQERRCLLILDNVESILLSGSPRQYLAGYEGYGELFRRVGESVHQSCMLLTSREQVAEVASFAGNNLPVRVLPLGGLSIEEGMAVLDDKGLLLAGQEGEELVDLYDGNPLALKIVSTSILELFDGGVRKFLGQGTAVFNGIRLLLERQFDRLSMVERQIMFWLAIDREWVTVGDLAADLLPIVPVAQLLESLEFLQGRSLIERKDGRFTQQPVVMEYAIKLLLGLVRQEICDGSPQLLLCYALMKAQAKDYVRESQIRVIVRPLLAMLESDLGSRESIVLVLRQILLGLRGDGFAVASYGAGNCLNLLCQLQADLTGLDLAGLSIRQADLREVSLPHVNFAGANLATSLFAESINDIYKLAISPDDRLIATSGSDGNISVWEIVSGQNILNIKAHEGITIGLTFTPDSKQLISSSFDRHIKTWDVESGVCLRDWNSSMPCYRIALSNNGKMIASGSECGNILVWDVETGEIIKTLVGHTLTSMDVAFHPQDLLLASSSCDTSIKLWDLTTGECIRTLAEHTQFAFSVNFNPLGDQLVSSSFDTSIKIWDVASGLCLQTMQEHSRATVEAFFSPDGRQIISASQDLTLRIWEQLQCNIWQCTKVLSGHRNNIWSIALDSKGRKLASGDLNGVLKIWDMKSLQCSRTLLSESRAFRALAFHPTGDLLVSSREDRQIYLWNINNGNCLSKTTAHQMAVWKITFLSEGQLLASCSMDGTIKLWNVVKNESLEGRSQPLQTSSTFILTIACHPRSEILASGTPEASIYFWNYRTGLLIGKLEQNQLGNNINILDLAFHPSGRWLAIASFDPDIRIWDMETGKSYQMLKGHTHQNWTVNFQPQGDLLASGGEDYTVRIWHIHTGECIHVLNGHTGAITCTAFSLDGSYLVSSSKDYTIRIWEVATGKCVQTLTGHTSLVNFVTYHPDADRRLLASCGHDETIRLWNTDTWECTKVLRPQRVYEEMDITGVTGLTTAQRITLKGLGAIDLA
jgi:WD40 repeat protein